MTGIEAKNAILTLSILTGLLLLITQAYAVYDLGICMDWWEPIVFKDFIWRYVAHVDESATGSSLPLGLHDQFVLTLYANTRADPAAEWIIQSHPSLVIRDSMTSRTDNGTVQSWLVESTALGSTDLVLQYILNKPEPPRMSDTWFILHPSTELEH